MEIVLVFIRFAHSWVNGPPNAFSQPGQPCLLTLRRHQDVPRSPKDEYLLAVAVEQVRAKGVQAIVVHGDILDLAAVGLLARRSAAASVDTQYDAGGDAQGLRQSRRDWRIRLRLE
jgi:hypothetical protein